MNPIPTNRAVRFGDVKATRDGLGVGLIDIQWLLGALMGGTTSNSEASSAKSKSPIKDITRALILRMLSEHPESNPLPPQPDITEVYRLCQECDPDFTPRHLGVLMGRQGSAGYRWLKKKKQSRVLRTVGYRWLLLIQNYLVAAPTLTARRSRLREIYETVMTEAITRGFDPHALRRDFVWVTPAIKAARSRRRSESP